MSPIVTPTESPRQRTALAMSIKSAWAQAIARADRQGQGTEGVPEITAKYAKAWADAGLDPNDPRAPKAPEGTEPAPDPEPRPAPPSYDGPSLREIDTELAAIESSGVVTRQTIDRKRELVSQRTAAYQAAGEGERREAGFRRSL